MSGASISEAYDIKTGKDVDVSGLTSDELEEKLKKGELCLNLSEALNNSDTNEVELFDYEGL